MPTLSISDDIFAPADTILLKFSGKNPFSVVPPMLKTLRYVMKLAGKDVRETDIRWDVTCDPKEFYGVWMGIKKNDRWTKTYYRILAQGVQSSTDKTGNITIRLKGYIKTNYEYSTFIQRSFWWFYNYMFYYRQRRMYLERAKDDVLMLKERLQRQLGQKS